MHHTPLFIINYYRDIFVKYLNKDYSRYIYGLRESEYQDIIDYIFNKNNKSSQIHTIDYYNKKLAELKKTDVNNKELFEYFIRSNNTIITLFCNEFLNLNDEFKSKELYDLITYFQISKIDREQYDQCYEKIKNSIKSFTILGGHSHEQKVKFYDNHIIVEAGQTLKEDELDTYSYVVISYNAVNDTEEIYSSIPLNYDSSNGYFV